MPKPMMFAIIKNYIIIEAAKAQTYFYQNFLLRKSNYINILMHKNNTYLDFVKVIFDEYFRQ